MREMISPSAQIITPQSQCATADEPLLSGIDTHLAPDDSLGDRSVDLAYAEFVVAVLDGFKRAGKANRACRAAAESLQVHNIFRRIQRPVVERCLEARLRNAIAPSQADNGPGVPRCRLRAYVNTEVSPIACIDGHLRAVGKA